MPDLFVVTAFRTVDGAAVYATGAAWTERLDEARPLSGAELEAALVWARGEQIAVCDPYAMKVRLAQSRPEPLSARERIRAEGAAVVARLGYGA